MNPREAGFLLLTSFLGNPQRKPLTVAQFRNLAKRMAVSAAPENGQREVEVDDFLALGYNRMEAQRIVALLSETELLQYYLFRGAQNGCDPITRVSYDYPLSVRQALGLDAPASLWAMGDRNLLQGKKIALVGSRTLKESNRNFAYEAGKQAALQGYTLVSGNASGADTIAQDACLEHGGRVISVVADELEKCSLRPNVLYLSEDGFDLPFSPGRAHSRNRVIHSLSPVVLVVQSSLQKGGTWSGVTKNLENNWSQVCVFEDGSQAAIQLIQRGAAPITMGSLKDISQLTSMTSQMKMEELL